MTSKNKSLQTEIEKQKRKNQHLEKYQKFVDAEQESQKLVLKARQIYKTTTEKAQKEYQQLILQANQFLETSKQQIAEMQSQAEIQKNSILGNAHQQSEQLQSQTNTECQKLIADAKLQAQQIIQEAENQLENAKSVFSDAELRRDEALRQLDGYEAAIIAVRNRLEGYGNQYLIPSDNLIDWMAEECGHTEPGQKMKELRTQIRHFVRSNTAADCDYVENRRREIAKQFVTDAFWGKVESVLARTKKDNFGKLQQELKDSFHLINSNGTAFRNARITNAFLDMCTEQIKLAAAIHEIKERQKEEQRQIKERIREEEKARRDFEKAQKEALKQELELQKQMAREREIIAKAQEEMQQRIREANEEQRAVLQAEFETQKTKYEQVMTELQEKLREAEEKNQRALSMAQQTKAGNVYIISNVGSFGENVYKIGMTRRLEPMDRVKELSDASVPFAFDVHAMIYSEDAPSLETALHKKFALLQVNKVNRRKEFFRVTLGELKKEIEDIGIETTWTLLAEAREYHETLTIEKAIADNPQAKANWLSKQLVLNSINLADEDDEENL